MSVQLILYFLLFSIGGFGVRLFQLVSEKVAHAGVEVVTGIAAAYVVVLVGIDLRIELDAGLDQSCRILQRVEVVHIIVGCSRNDKQTPFQIGSMGDGAD